MFGTKVGHPDRGEPGSTPRMVMVVSFNKQCEASSYAKSAYLFNCRIKESCVSGSETLAVFPSSADTEQKK